MHPGPFNAEPQRYRFSRPGLKRPDYILTRPSGDDRIDEGRLSCRDETGDEGHRKERRTRSANRMKRRGTEINRPLSAVLDS